jgi:hypothetical protein
MNVVQWILNTLGLYVTTVGALLIFLYMYRSPQGADYWSSAQGRSEYVRHRRRLIIGTGLLAAWLVLENASALFLS